MCITIRRANFILPLRKRKRKEVTKMKKTKKAIAAVLSAVTMFSVASFGTVATHAATRGRTMDKTYCTVKISQKLLNKSGRQYASVKLNTGTGWNIFSTGRPIKVTLRDGQGRYICSWTAKGGDKIRLGDDHSEYRICLDYASGEWDVVGNTYKWKITSPKDCTIY